MTERLRISINISKYFQTLEFLEKKLSDKNEPNTGNISMVLCVHPKKKRTKTTTNRSEKQKRRKKEKEKEKKIKEEKENKRKKKKRKKNEANLRSGCRPSPEDKLLLCCLPGTISPMTCRADGRT